MPERLSPGITRRKLLLGGAAIFVAGCGADSPSGSMGGGGYGSNAVEDHGREYGPDYSPIPHAQELTPISAREFAQIQDTGNIPKETEVFLSVAYGAFYHSEADAVKSSHLGVVVKLKEGVDVTAAGTDGQLASYTPTSEEARRVPEEAEHRAEYYDKLAKAAREFMKPYMENKTLQKDHIGLDDISGVTITLRFDNVAG